MDKRYANALDVYALTTSYPQRGRALAIATQRTALSYLLKKTSKKELLLMLSIAKDLAYLEDAVYSYYAKLLNKR